MHDRIVELSASYEVPIDEKAIEINSERLHTLVRIGYVRKIAIFPGVTRDWPFMMNVDALGLK